MKVGDYVRTKQKVFQPPQIAKIKNMKRDAWYKNQYYIELDHNLLPDYECYIYEEDIVKSATPNKRHGIIDLIEIGDYVNGHRVEEIDFESETLYTESEYHCGSIDFDMIKSIVTKEQFEAMEYKCE